MPETLAERKKYVKVFTAIIVVVFLIALFYNFSLAAGGLKNFEYFEILKALAWTCLTAFVTASVINGIYYWSKWTRTQNLSFSFAILGLFGFGFIAAVGYGTVIFLPYYCHSIYIIHKASQDIDMF